MKTTRPVPGSVNAPPRVERGRRRVGWRLAVGQLTGLGNEIGVDEPFPVQDRADVLDRSRRGHERAGRERHRRPPRLF